MKLAFIGFGTIGKIIYSEIIANGIGKITPIAVLDPFLGKEDIRSLEGNSVKICKDLDELIKEGPDFVIEAANQDIAREYTLVVLDRNINVISLSVGAYLDEDIYDKIQGNIGKGRLYIPSGAMPCIDAVKGAGVRQIDSVELTTRKSPDSLKGAPGLSNVDLNNLLEPLVVFQGSAMEAIKLFPKNVNIAATISLAGIGPYRTKVTVIADPQVKHNIHSISMEGEFGSFNSTIKCLPSSNPKTSLMAALSVIALLKDLVSTVHIGN